MPNFDLKVVYFFYGLTFFMSGFLILHQKHWMQRFTDRASDLRLARKIIWLGLFGVSHGFAEWSNMFSRIYPQLFLIKIIELFLLSLSFAFLFSFGAALLGATKPRYRKLYLAPAFIYLCWLFFYFLKPLFTDYNDPAAFDQIWINGRIFARYLLALPGGLISAYALYLQLDEIKRLIMPRLDRSLKLISVFLGIYALLAGLIVPASKFWPSNVLNFNSFYEFTRVPVPIFRSLIAIVVSYFMITILEVFAYETKRREEDYEKAEAIIDERERIQRDIHDGILQNLYAIGLTLSTCQTKVENDNLRQSLQGVTNNLNEAMQDLRFLITNPQTKEVVFSFEALLKNCCQHFENFAGIKVNLTVIEGKETSTYLNARQNTHLYYIIKEALSNVLKHASASQVIIKVREDDVGLLEILIADNGLGFELGEINGKTKMGIRNMQARAKYINGQVAINSKRGIGTEVKITIGPEVA